jgi:hypothetical protein
MSSMMCSGYGMVDLVGSEGRPTCIPPAFCRDAGATLSRLRERELFRS